MTSKRHVLGMSEFKYTDGIEIEQYLIELLKASTDLSSQSWLHSSLYGNWPLKYHLSPERANLLRPFSFAGLDVLEIGAGFGAISRLIAERANFLTAMDGSARRLEGLQMRLRDLHNWETNCCNLSSFLVERKYDAVLSIGVLEYAQMYLEVPSTVDPFGEFIRIAKSNLNANGVLVLAIENKLGAKYLSGCNEDHTGRPADGVCGYPQFKKGPRTFSKFEIQSMLEAAGFEAIQFYYPFPDYKLPNSILSESFLNDYPKISANLATNVGFVNYGTERLRFFPDLLSCRSFADARLLGEHSNSFLVFASPKRESSVLNSMTKNFSRTTLAYRFDSFRSFTKETRFSLDKGTLISKSEILRAPGGADALGSLERPKLSVTFLATTDYCDETGENLSYLLASHSFFSGWSVFITELESFLKWTISNFSNEMRLPGSALEAVFWKAKKIREGTYVLSDQNVQLDSSFPVSWLILRNIRGLQNVLNLRAKIKGFETFEELYKILCKRLGVSPQLAVDVEMESVYFQTVECVGEPSQCNTENLTFSLREPLNKIEFPISRG